VALLGPIRFGEEHAPSLYRWADLPTSGEVSYRGQTLNGANPVWPWSSELCSVALADGTPERRAGPRSARRGAVERRQRAERAIDTIGLDGFESAYPKSSREECATSRFARALVVEPMPS